ncbi:Hypothetical predicted protein [Cloeon dipterum]|uniref:Bromo domain-containing protein n=1 Tax=Cloeon dipterum TaxID=197152 RepID=A0A8S1CHA3_9INSE|nr:Hypothetical predicted protein [Cloeon dipterum]
MEHNFRVRRTRSSSNELRKMVVELEGSPSPSGPTYQVVDGKVELPFMPDNEPEFRYYGLQMIEREIRKRWKHSDCIQQFKLPVNENNPNCLGYYSKIKHPMDLGTVLKRLQHHYYINCDDCFKDMRLVVKNCKTFYPPDSDEVQHAEQLNVMIREIDRLVYVSEKLENLVPTIGAQKTGPKRRESAAMTGRPIRKIKKRTASAPYRVSDGTDVSGVHRDVSSANELQSVSRGPQFESPIKGEEEERLGLESVDERERNKERADKPLGREEEEEMDRIAEFERLETLRLAHNEGKQHAIIEPPKGNSSVVMVNLGYDPNATRDCFDE